MIHLSNGAPNFIIYSRFYRCIKQTFDKNMFVHLILLCEILCHSVAAVNFHLYSDVNFKQKITVALSERKPFVFHDQNGILKGLDVSIIESFAKKHNLLINYVFVNVSLNYVFTNEDFTSLPAHVNFRYTFKIVFCKEEETYCGDFFIFKLENSNFILKKTQFFYLKNSFFTISLAKQTF